MECRKRSTESWKGGNQVPVYDVDKVVDLDRMDVELFELHHLKYKDFRDQSIREKWTESLKTGDWKEIESVIGRGDHSVLAHFHTSPFFILPLHDLNPLVLAAKFGHFECLRVLLDTGPQNFSFRIYQDAIVEAVRNTNSRCVHLLVESRFFNSMSPTRSSEAIEEIRSGRSRQEEFMARNFEEDIDKGDNMTSFSCLITSGCPSSCLKALSDCNVDLNRIDPKIGLTPLMCAVLAEHVECINYLLDRGVDKNVMSFDENRNRRIGRTALMFAACLRNTTCLQLILSKCTKDNINFRNQTNWTALGYAFLYGNTESVSLLLQSGAKIELPEPGKEILLRAAMKSGNPECVKIIMDRVPWKSFLFTFKLRAHYLVEHAECLEVFLENVPLELDRDFSRGRTLLTIAASEGSPDSVRLLLDKGANIDHVDRRRRTALTIASSVDHNKVIDLLLERGADVNIPDRRQYSAIMWAIVRGSVKGVQLLLNAFPDLDKSAEDQQTVFTLALEQLEGLCLELLLTSGQLFENGRLKQSHLSAMHHLSRKRNAFSIRMLSTAANYRVFDWDWCSPYTFRQLAFVAVHSGMCPGKMKVKQLEVYPLVLAFGQNELPVVKYFLSNLYFFPEDYSMLCTNSLLRETIAGYDSKELSAILDLLTLQPMSLQTWSFLSVSKAISCPGQPALRRERVDSLPLPELLKQQLKFQTDASSLCRDQWKDIGINVGSIDFSLPKGCIISCDESCYYCGGMGKRYEGIDDIIKKFEKLNISLPFRLTQSKIIISGAQVCLKYNTN